ncbi:MAG: NAD/NADP octopine/nopaline dehydrogenase family protein [Spirochaetes bacterium]|nr:NAD/NADP octopine/nopaline dehydrogenase family protein [Spirochaetota bacterium]
MSEIRKIAVLGAGNGGFMAAADMGSRGYEAVLYSRNPEKIKGVANRGGIEVLDIDSNPSGTFGMVRATSDIADAVKGAHVILNPVPYFVCEDYARRVAPHLEEGQIVLYLGKGGASLDWAKVVRELGIKKKVYLADCNTLPYGASRKGDYQVRLENRTQNLIVATFPGKDIEYVGDVVETLFPSKLGYTIRRGQNAIDSILVDYNAITHTPPMICNAALIESGDPDFHLFGPKENSRSVVRIIEKIDRERMAIGQKLGLKQYALEEEILMVKWNPHGEEHVLPLYDAIHTPFLEVCEGPFTLDTRHLTEDIPYGLITYSSLGRMLGVPTPVSDAVITIAETLLDRDFRSMGRTVERMGFDPGWSAKQLSEYLHNGTI